TREGGSARATTDMKIASSASNAIAANFPRCGWKFMATTPFYGASLRTRHATSLAETMRVITRGRAVTMTAARRETVRRNAQELKAAAYSDVQRCISERRRRARDNARS